MASGNIVLIESFDLYDAIAALEASGKWLSYTNVSGAFGLTSGGRFGVGNSLKMNTGGNNAALTKALPNPTTRTQTGFAFRLNALPGSEQRFLHLHDNNDNTNCRLAITTAGKLKLTVWGSTVVESTNALPVGSWVWIEWIAFISTTVGTHKVYVDGVEEITWGPGDNTPSGFAVRWDKITLGNNLSGLSLNADIDDFVVADASALSPPDLWGDSRISVLEPTSVATNTGFAEVGAGSIAAALDGTAPADDTSYVEADAVNDLLYMATSQTLPSAVSVIHGVGISARHRKTASGSRSITPGVRISATEYPGTAVPLFETVNSSQTIFQQNPNTAAAWTKSQVEGVEFGAKVTT